MSDTLQGLQRGRCSECIAPAGPKYVSVCDSCGDKAVNTITKNPAASSSGETPATDTVWTCTCGARVFRDFVKGEPGIAPPVVRDALTGRHHSCAEHESLRGSSGAGEGTPPLTPTCRFCNSSGTLHARTYSGPWRCSDEDNCAARVQARLEVAKERRGVWERLAREMEVGRDLAHKKRGEAFEQLRELESRCARLEAEKVSLVEHITRMRDRRREAEKETEWEARYINRCVGDVLDEVLAYLSQPASRPEED